MSDNNALEAKSAAMAWYAGSLIPRDQVRIPITDRAVTFGDSLYEVLRLIKGKPFQLERHLDRVFAGADALIFSRPQVREGVRLAVADLVDFVARQVQVQVQGKQKAHNGLWDDVVLYLQVSRGDSGSRKHKPTAEMSPTIFGWVEPWDHTPMTKLREQGARLCSVPDIRWNRCDIKSTNLLGNILPVMNIDGDLYDDVLLTGPNGALRETSHGSFALEQDGQIVMPPLGIELLGSVTREVIKDQLGDRFIVKPITVRDLDQSQGAMVLGTTSEVLPVVAIDGKPIGNGKPGELSLKLWQTLRREMGFDPA